MWKVVVGHVHQIEGIRIGWCVIISRAKVSDDYKVDQHNKISLGYPERMCWLHIDVLSLALKY